MWGNWKFCFVLHIMTYHFILSLGQEEPSTTIKDAWDAYKSKEYPLLPVESVGFIQRSDLGRILETQTELVLNATKILNTTFFETFSKFIVSYDWSSKNDSEKTLMLETLTKATEYNLKNRAKGDDRIKIMISITPKGNIIDDLNRVSDIINQTNSKLPGTIIHLLLHYGSLRLNSEAIPLVREDIATCNRYVKQFSEISNVTCGFVLDARNCGKDKEKLSSLGFSPDNLVIFDPRETTVDGFTTKLVSMVPCLLTILRKTKFGMKYLWPITVDLKNGFFNRRPSLYAVKSDLFQYIVEDITIKNADDRMSFHNTTVSKYHVLTEDWLRRPLQLSKHNFGVTLHPTAVTAPESMIPHILGTFRTVILEDAGEPASGKVNKQFDLAKNMASIIKQLNSREALNTDQSIFDDGIPAHIMLSVTIKHDTWERNKRDVDAVWSAAVEANRIYPGIVNAILFNWNSCLKSDVCQPIKGTSALRKYVYQHFQLLESVFLYALESRASSPVELGIYLEKQILYELAKVFRPWEVQAYGSLFSKADLLVHKINLDEDEILKEGALKISQSFIPNIVPLKILLESLLKVIKLPFPKTTVYHIKVSGCGKNQGIVKEQTRVAEYARFWEIMNNWVLFENASVILDTAFEEAEYSPKTKCRVDRSPGRPKGCTCGWWRVTRSNPSDKGSEGNGVTLTDKKMIAIELGEKKFPGSVTPTTKLDIWSVSGLLVLAALVTVIVSIFAAYLGQRHRRTQSSNGGLTTKDIKGFFRGDVNQLSKLEGNLYGGCGHPDSQPYNKQMYELSPTTFKVGNRCLGKGEFGTVFFSTIIRDNVEKEVAVKMISRQRHSVLDQAHGRYLALKGLISEIKLMSYVGEHVHLVKLEGAYTAKLKKGEVMVFMEYCERGSLESYLHNCLNNVNNKVDGTSSGGTAILPLELSDDLYRWAGEIACGMEFLASKDVVHADLASRNVLLNSQKCAKISDFGLSRRLYDYSEYLKTEQGPLPWRWMAPESLRKMIFNEKSDVWSFGVTLWEMYTLGDVPYPGLSWDVNFPVMLEGGVRLHEPRWNGNNMYSIMKKCWERIPDDRPQFSEIHSMITSKRFLSIDEKDISYVNE